VIVEQIIAGLALAACAVLLVRLMLGQRRQQRFDAALQHAWAGCRSQTRKLYRWRAVRRESAAAAEEAIRRARAAADRDGNVIRPRSFRGPRKPH